MPPHPDEWWPPRRLDRGSRCSVPGSPGLPGERRFPAVPPLPGEAGILQRASLVPDLVQHRLVHQRARYARACPAAQSPAHERQAGHPGHYRAREAPPLSLLFATEARLWKPRHACEYWSVTPEQIETEPIAARHQGLQSGPPHQASREFREHYPRIPPPDGQALQATASERGERDAASPPSASLQPDTHRLLFGPPLVPYADAD